MSGLASTQIKWISGQWNTFYECSDVGNLSQQLFNINNIISFTYEELKINMIDALAQVQAITECSSESLDILQIFMTNFVTLLTEQPGIICYVSSSTPLINN